MSRIVVGLLIFLAGCGAQQQATSRQRSSPPESSAPLQTLPGPDVGWNEPPQSLPDEEQEVWQPDWLPPGAVLNADNTVTMPDGRVLTREEAYLEAQSELPRNYLRPSAYEFADACWWISIPDIETLIIQGEDAARAGWTYEEATASTNELCNAQPDAWAQFDCFNCFAAIDEAIWRQ